MDRPRPSIKKKGGWCRYLRLAVNLPDVPADHNRAGRWLRPSTHEGKTHRRRGNQARCLSFSISARISDAGTSRASANRKSMSIDGFFMSLSRRLTYDGVTSRRAATSSCVKSFRCRNRRIITPNGGRAVFFFGIFAA